MRLNRYDARGYETLMLLEGTDWLIWLPSEDIEVKNPVNIIILPSAIPPGAILGSGEAETVGGNGDY